MRGFLSCLTRLTKIADKYNISWSYTFNLYRIAEKRQEKYLSKLLDNFSYKDYNRKQLEKLVKEGHPLFMSQHTIETKYIPDKCCELIDRFYRLKTYKNDNSGKL